MDNYVVHMLYDYLLFRVMRIRDISVKAEVRMIFLTPLTLKYQGEFFREFRMDAILKAIRSRIFRLDCFEGFACDILEEDEDDHTVKICGQEYHLASVSRYFTRKNENMVLKGLKGYVLLEELTEELLELLLIGELIHIGKNTDFGFGRYYLKFLDKSDDIHGQMEIC